MKIYDFPEEVSIYERFMPWARDHEEELAKALSDEFTNTYKPRIESAKDDVVGEASVILFFVSLWVIGETTLAVGILAGTALYFSLSFFAKHCAKKCAVRIFESTAKHDVLKKCFADILNEELTSAENDDQRKVVHEFYKYAICKTHDIEFKYRT